MREFLLMPVAALLSLLAIPVALLALLGLGAISAYGELRGVVRLGGFNRIED